MMRRGFQWAARLSHHRALPAAPHILPRFTPSSAFGSSVDSLVSRFCLEKTDLKDYALPNASWCPDMLSLYQEFLEKTKTDGWIKLPSFKSNRDHIQGLKLPSGLAVTSDKSDWRIFTRCIQVEGQGYEYVIFFHPSKKKSVCLFQPGPYLEGAPGPPAHNVRQVFSPRLLHLAVQELRMKRPSQHVAPYFSGMRPCVIKNGYTCQELAFTVTGLENVGSALTTVTGEVELAHSSETKAKKSGALAFPGFAHGGSLAAMMDETFSKTAYLAGEGLFTLSLNIRFKNLIPVGSLAVLNTDVEKIEDQKLYMSCVTQSRDQKTVYAKCSGVFLQLQLEQE